MSNRWYDYCLSLNGSSQYAYCANANCGDLYEDNFTVECWFNLSSLSSGSQFLIAIGDGYSDGWRLTLYNTAGGAGNSRAGFAAGYTPGYLNQSCYYTFVTNTWYHLAVSVEATGSSTVLYWYVNGAFQETDTDTTNYGTVLSASEDLTIGASPGGGNYFAGKISEVRFWTSKYTDQGYINHRRFGKQAAQQGALIMALGLNNSGTDYAIYGNNHSVSLSGSPSYSTDVPDWDYSSLLTNAAYSANGALQNNDQFHIVATGNLTMEIAVKYVSGYLPYLGRERAFIEKTNEWGMGVRNISGTYYFYHWWYESSTKHEEMVAWTPTADVWYCLSVTNEDVGSSRDIKFFVNGAQQGTTQNNSGGGAIDNTSGGFYIQGSYGYYYRAYLWEARVWDVARTPAQIAANWNVYIDDNTEADLITCCPVSTLADLSQNDFTGDFIWPTPTSAYLLMGDPPLWPQTVTPKPALAIARVAGGPNKWFDDGNADIRQWFGANADELYMPGEPASGDITGKIASNVLADQGTPDYQQALTGESDDPKGAGFTGDSTDSFDAASSTVHNTTGPLAVFSVLRRTGTPTSLTSILGRMDGTYYGWRFRYQTTNTIRWVVRGDLATIDASRTEPTLDADAYVLGWYDPNRSGAAANEREAQVGMAIDGQADNTPAGVPGDITNSGVFALGSVGPRNAGPSRVGPTIFWSGDAAITVIDNHGRNLSTWASGNGAAPTVLLGAVTRSPSPAVATSAAVSPTVALGAITRSPSPASSTAAAVSPGVVLGAIALSPSPAPCTATAVSPTVALGAITVSPNPAVATSAAVSPTVAFGGIDVPATPAVATSAAVDPGVSLGEIRAYPGPSSSQSAVLAPRFEVLASPSPAAATAAAIDPEATLGGVAEPLPATCTATAVSPGVVLGAVVVTPSPAVTTAAAVSPGVALGAVTASPGPAVATAAAVDPTAVLGALIVSPSPAAASSAAVSPGTVMGAVTASPSPAAATAAAVGPSNALTQHPQPAAATATAVTPGVQFDQVASPSPAAATATAVTPFVTLAGIAYPPPAAATAVAVTPTAWSDLYGLPGPATATAIAISPTVVLGAVTVSPSPAIASAAAIDPTVQMGAISTSASPATASATAITPTVLLGAITAIPGPATTTAAAISPSTIVGPVTVSPGPAAALATAVTPVALPGPITTSASPATATATAVTPSAEVVASVHVETWNGSVAVDSHNGGVAVTRWSGKVRIE